MFDNWFAGHQPYAMELAYSAFNITRGGGSGGTMPTTKGWTFRGEAEVILADFHDVVDLGIELHVHRET